VKKDYRLLTFVATIIAIAAAGTVISMLPSKLSLSPVDTTPRTASTADLDSRDSHYPGNKTATEDTASQQLSARLNPRSPTLTVDPAVDRVQHGNEARSRELEIRFQQATLMLHSKQYDYAVKALHRVLELAPRMPEAHTNMGFALIGLEQYKAARDFFNTAININPLQLNAYYGLALTYEGEERLQLAISAMESYVHLAGEDDRYLKKAHAALWEWRSAVQKQRETSSPPRSEGK